MTKPAATSLRSIYQLKITLSGIRPPIWRRFLIASTNSLADLHLIVQMVMGWTDSHLPFETEIKLPVCLKGSRACPQEDVGGWPGYEMLLEAIADPNHPQHANMIEWLGEPFDPEHFDLADVNALLQN